MSGINSINSSNVTFSGKKAENNNDVKKKPTVFTNAANALTKPIKDEFEKKYEGAKATPGLVADFVADKTVGIAVTLASAALVFSKSRKATNGLTAALKESISAARSATGIEKAKVAGKIREVAINTFDKIKENNLNVAQKARAAKESGQITGLKKSLSEAILRPVEFDNASKLGSKIDKAFGAESKLGQVLAKKGVKADLAGGIKNVLGKVGISNGDELIDTTIALGASAVAANGAGSISNHVSSKDDSNLAGIAKLADKFNQMAEIATDIIDVT